MKAGARPLAEDALGTALRHAARACLAVREGRALPQALAVARTEAAAAHGAIQDLAYRTLRVRGAADVVIDHLCQRPPHPPLLRELLAVSLCALDCLEAPEPVARYAPYTVVDQAVSACALDAALVAARGVVNAVLRRALRERESIAGLIANSELARWNYPAWWIARIRAAYPDEWPAILDAGQHAPPLTLRLNRRRCEPEGYVARLADTGIAADRIGPWAVRLRQPLPVDQIPGFREGMVSVQDEAAQRAAVLCEAEAGMRVLDACAAPGGKTAHLLELADIELIALDSDRERLSRVRENLDRLGLTASLVHGDARATSEWWDGRPFDRILADVPCTASGIVRRHPDIRWLRREADIDTLSLLQQQILDALWRLLAPGGKLVLVTCSLFPPESEGLARAFGARHADALRQAAPGQLLPHAGCDTDHDGLFLAQFQKSA